MQPLQNGGLAMDDRFLKHKQERKNGSSIRFALCLIMAVALCLFFGSPSFAEGGQKQMTIMLYITGSDLESGGGAATRDISEILKARPDADKVNIIMMTGGSKKWWGGFPAKNTVIYEARGSRPKEVYRSDLMNMGDPESLSLLLDYGREHYPAEKYALILWNHGGGPMLGVCYDEMFYANGTPDSLDALELESALRASLPSGDDKLEWIGFDACLMSSVEIAHLCAPFARYMIASQETEPGSGWDYSFLAGMDFGETGAETGRRIVDAYYDDAYEQLKDSAYITLACIDLERISTVETAMNGLFSVLNRELNESSFSLQSGSRIKTKAIGRASTGSEYDLVDLRHLAQQYATQEPEAAAILEDAVESAVVYQRTNVENTHGLSVYYPYYNKQSYTDKWSTKYRELNFARGYTDYMSEFASIWLGEQLTEWSQLQASAKAAPEAAQQFFTMPLTQAQADAYASAELYILEKQQGNQYVFTYCTDDVTAGQSNVLNAAYGYNAMYALDSEGSPITGILSYHIIDGVYHVGAILYETLEGFGGEQKSVYLQYRPSGATGKLTLIGVVDLSSDAELTTGKQTIDLKDWEYIELLNFPRLPTRDVRGALLPFYQWEVSQYVTGYGLYNMEPWHMELYPEQLSGDDLYAMFVVSDTQNNRYASELISIPNPNVTLLNMPRTQLMDSQGVKLSLTGMRLLHSEVDKGLVLELEADNATDEAISFFADNFIADNIVLNGVTEVMDAVEPNSRATLYLKLTVEELLAARLQRIGELRFDLHFGHEQPYQISVALGVELGRHMPEPPEEKPVLAEDDRQGLRCQVRGLSVEEDGSVTAELRFINSTDQTIACDFYGVYMNDILSQSSMLSKLRLPAGCMVNTSLHILNEVRDPFSFTEEKPLREQIFGAMGVRQVEKISLITSDESMRLDLVLNQPIPYSGAQEAPVAAQPSKALMEYDGLAVGLRQLTLEGGQLQLEVTLYNGKDEDMLLAVPEGRANGQPIPVYLKSEDDQPAIQGLKLAAHTIRQGTISLDIRGIAEQGFALNSIGLSFACRGQDRVTHIFGEAAIEAEAGLPLDEAERHSIPSDRLKVAAAEAGRIPEELKSGVGAAFVYSAVGLPQDWRQYRTRLFATPQDAGAFDSGYYVIAGKVGDEYSILYRGGPLVMGEDGAVGADYHGLLLCCGAEDPIIMLAIERMNEGGVLTVETMPLIMSRLCSFDYDKESVISSVRLQADWQKETLSVIGIESDAVFSEHDYFKAVNIRELAYLPARDQKGKLLHLSQWDSPDSMRVYEYDLRNGCLDWRFVPARQQDGLYVLFAIKNKDGSSYCPEPVLLEGFY